MVAKKTAKTDEAAQSTIGDAQLGEVSRLARLLVDADAEIERIENELRGAKANAVRIREEALPGAMQELDLKEVTLGDGSKIKIVPEVYCSITKADQERAFTWLEENNFGGLIKTAVEIEFGREQRESAIEFYSAQVDAQGESGNAVSISSGVHPATLKAWLKEQLAAGRNVPLDLFNARPIDVAKVTLPKTIKRV